MSTNNNKRTRRAPANSAPANNNNANNNNNNNNNNSQNVIQPDQPARRRNNGQARIERQPLKSIADYPGWVIPGQVNNRDGEAIDLGSAYGLGRLARPEDIASYIPNQRDTLISKAVTKQLNQLASRLDSVESRSKNVAPLAKVRIDGHGISSGAVAAVHMLVDPARADPVPLPGQQPAALCKVTDLPITNQILEHGEGGVIVTPFGKYTTYNTAGYSAAADYPLDEHFAPFEGGQLTTSCGYQNASLTAYSDTQRVRNVWALDNSKNVDKQPYIVAKTFSLQDATPDELIFEGVGNVSSVAQGAYAATGPAITIQPVSNGTAYLMRASSRSAPIANPTNFGIWTQQAMEVPAGQSTTLFWGETDEVRVEYENDNNIIPQQEVAVGNFVIQWKMSIIPTGKERLRFTTSPRTNNHLPVVNPNNASLGFVSPTLHHTNDVWSAHYMPSLKQLEYGGYIAKSRFLALSALVTNDSSSLNNGGFIMQHTATTSAFGSYASVKEHIRSVTNRKYIGRLRDGGYQIYVPDTQEMAKYDSIDDTPFVQSDNILNYCMMFWFDYSSAPQGNEVPTAVALHAKIDGVFATESLNGIISPTVIPWDYTWGTALGILRHKYCPCENPDHLKKIKGWLKDAIGTTIDYGKTFITDHKEELYDVGSALVKTLGTAAIAAMAV